MTDLQVSPTPAPATEPEEYDIVHTCCHRAEHLAFCGVYLPPEVELVARPGDDVRCRPCLEVEIQIHHTNRCPQTAQPCDCPEIQA